jgi:hypothetical protein
VLQGDNVSWGSSVLNYIQLVTRSDLGRFYADRSGVVTFRDRLDPINVGASVTFADDGTGVPFQGIAVEYGSELLYNRVGIDREGGTLQTVTDAASQALYGASSLSERGLLLNSDTQSLAMANYLLGIYAEPELRVAELVVELSPLTGTQQAGVLGIDIASVIAVTWTPNGVGAAMERACIVEGIAHDDHAGFAHRDALARRRRPALVPPTRRPRVRASRFQRPRFLDLRGTHGTEDMGGR